MQAALPMLAIWAAAGLPAGDKDACRRSAETGQDLRAGGKLIAARDEFRRCAKATCPRIVQVDCARWADELEASVPTLVFHATDRGHDVTDVSVIMDGQALMPHLEGKAVSVDPGPHVLKFGYGGSEIVESVLVSEGEKNRQVTVSFGEIESAKSTALPAVPAAVEPRSGIPTGTWILGGTGAAAFASFAFFGLTGRADLKHLRTSCAPSCTDAQVDPVRRELLVADLSLVVGTVALALAAYLLLSD